MIENAAYREDPGAYFILLPCKENVNPLYGKHYTEDPWLAHMFEGQDGPHGLLDHCARGACLADGPRQLSWL